MQTFLPYPDFIMSAACLDNKRLGKQRVEARQIYNCLKGPNGWRNHPAVKMWHGYDEALSYYHDAIIVEWIGRGFQNSMQILTEKSAEDVSKYIDQKALPMPDWLGDLTFHASHRSNLLRKDHVWYSQFGWAEPDNLPYVWPVK